MSIRSTAAFCSAAAVALLTTICIAFSTESYALSWLDVVNIAQGVNAPSVGTSNPGSSATPPPIDGQANMGTGSGTDASFNCPSAGLGILAAGYGNLFDDYVIAGGVCSCTVTCCAWFVCKDLPTVGTVTKFWENTAFIEVVRHRGCSPATWGVNWSVLQFLGNGARSAGGDDGFYHVHAMLNPGGLTGIKETMEAVCHIQAVKDTFPLPYLSEIDFSWNPGGGDLASPTAWSDVIAEDPEHIAKKALWSTNHQTAAAAQMVESLACVGECTVITAGGTPMDSLGNCSGCNGLVAPYNGKPTGLGGRRGAELLAHRFVNLMMNARGWKSTTSSAAYCNGGDSNGSPDFRKNEFRLQSVYPADESSMRKLGAPTAIVAGESGKQGGFMSQDYVFLLWKRRECCASARYCSPKET